MRHHDHLTSAQQNSLLREIGRALVKAAPRNWEELRLECDALFDFSTTEATAVLDDGSTEQMSTPVEVAVKLGKLRAGMYTPGKGTWYRAVCRVTRPGRFKAHYSYDEEPSFPIPAYDHDFLRDSRAYPRDSASTPDWLRRRLAAALEAEAVAKANDK
ncbi:hypothetical protein LG943_11285 [Streptomonospora sp. S1-112]|uniref:Uncharacterized protein n=1 Tax=Streptomonospora mangrovi TaxID=2883123 RepID=A0A9X3NMS4_9ACTN|nr:hypothetical protein [Streptomonospora mangrovi]MDA0564901.1 hypothetical protein [Streptomonospora mangrovi]